VNGFKWEYLPLHSLLLLRAFVMPRVDDQIMTIRSTYHLYKAYYLPPN